MGKKKKLPQTIGGVAVGLIVVMAFLILISYPKIDVRIYPDEFKPVTYATDFNLIIAKNKIDEYSQPTKVCFYIKNMAESIDSVPIRANNLLFTVSTNAECEDCLISEDLNDVGAQESTTACRKMLVNDEINELNLELKTSWNSLALPLTQITQINCEKTSEEEYRMSFHCNKNNQ